jgi:uncharacterized RDD family membrane protein YckC
MESTTYKLADNGTRFMALIIDSILVGIVAGALGAGGRWFLGGSISFLVGVGYHWLFLTRNNGQTPGKMLMGIKVIKSDGTELTGIDAVLRYLGYYINTAVFFLGWIWAFIDPQQQGWHDKIARTFVVVADDKQRYDEVDIKAKRKNDIY